MIFWVCGLSFLAGAAIGWNAAFYIVWSYREGRDDDRGAHSRVHGDVRR